MNRQRIRKELKEWGIFIALLLFLYFTGLYKDVSVLAQRAVLATGVANPKIEIQGKKPPADYNFSLTNMDGQTIPFKEFEGKVVFVNVWASWCAPCLAEMPNINNLYRRFEREEDMVFVMLNIDRERQKALDLLDKKDYKFPVYFLSEGRMPQAYESNLIPVTYVLDRAGNIAIKKEGSANYHNKNFIDYLHKLLNQQS